MKKITLLFIALTVSFSNIYAREVQKQPTNKMDWQEPKVAKSLILKINSKIKDLDKKKARNEDQLRDSKGQLTEKQKDKIEKTLKDIDSRINELNISKTDIERLANDKAHIYNLVNSSNSCVFKDNTDNKIKIQGANDALFIHEIRHISLSLQSKNGLRFSNNNLLLPVFADGSADEIQGYRAQYAYEPNSLPGVYPKYFEQVNLEYISGIKKEDGSLAYVGLRKIFDDDRKIAESKKKLDIKSISQTNVSTYVSKDSSHNILRRNRF